LSFADINLLFAQLGMGGVAGFVVGFAFKKMLKMLLILVGVFFAILQYLAYVGLITINYDRMFQSMQGFTKVFEGGFNLPAFLTTNIPLAGTFVVGFGLGFKFG